MNEIGVVIWQLVVEKFSVEATILTKYFYK